MQQPHASSSIAGEDDIKIMIAGDSISHGINGDYTWRYRLWQWLRSNDINFRFVGPYRGTHKPTPPSTPQAPSPEEQPEAWSSNGSYAPGVDSSFISTRHFCQWGYQTAQAKDTIAAQVFAFQPDYLLVVLGFNDLGWFVSGPDELLSDMKNLVDNARGVKSNVKFAIADVPHRTRLDGRQDLIDGTEKYNGKLAEAIHEWSTEDSPVRLVGFCENYDCGTDSCPAGYDGLHPNTLGDYQIAQAFSRVLHHDFEFGSGELEIPVDVCI